MFFFVYILLLYASTREHSLLNLGHVCNFSTFRVLYEIQNSPSTPRVETAGSNVYRVPKPEKLLEVQEI